MNNIIIACAVAAVVAFAISFALGYVVIPFLHKLKFGQTILDIGPKWHKNKQGTPTMGGILFIVGTVVAFGVVVPSLYEILMYAALFPAASCS